MMIVSSGFMFHMSHAFAKNVSRSMNDAMLNNPDLMRQFAAATAGEMNKNGGGSSALFPAQVLAQGGGPAQSQANAQAQAQAQANAQAQAQANAQAQAQALTQQGGGMRGPSGMRGHSATKGPGYAIGVSPSRIDEVLEFNRELDEAAQGARAAASPGANPAARPPLPAMTKAARDPTAPPVKPPAKGRALQTIARVVPAGDRVEADTDLVEIMSAASEASHEGSGLGSAVSSTRRNGRTRRTLVL
jgi:hypothetical protein